MKNYTQEDFVNFLKKANNSDVLRFRVAQTDWITRNEIMNVEYTNDFFSTRELFDLVHKIDTLPVFNFTNYKSQKFKKKVFKNILKGFTKEKGHSPALVMQTIIALNNSFVNKKVRV